VTLIESEHIALQQTINDHALRNFS